MTLPENWLHVSWGPTKEIGRKSIGLRWCFGCRQRLEHEAVMLDYEAPSYYEPLVVLRCSKCGKDRTEFGT